MKKKIAALLYIVIIFSIVLIGNNNNKSVKAETNLVPKKDYSANLVAKWVFDDTNTDYVVGNKVKDLSGKGNDLTTYNITYKDDEELGRSAYFNGSNSYMQANNPVIPIGKKSIVIKLKFPPNTQCGMRILSTVEWDQSGFIMQHNWDSQGINIAEREQNSYGIGSTTTNSIIGDNKSHTLIYTDPNDYNKQSKVFVDKVDKEDSLSTYSKIRVSPHQLNLLIGRSKVNTEYYKGYIQSIEIYDEAIDYEVKATSISLNKTSLNLNVGQTDNLIATVKLDDTTNKNVKWTTSDENIATVDENGKVTAIKVGNATITAKTTDGTNLAATCDITVVEANKDRGILAITMNNGNIKEYDMSKEEISSFVNWFDTSTKPQSKFEFNKKVAPYKTVKEYLVYDKISSFEVKEYEVTQ